MLEKYWSFIPEETPEKWQHLLRGLSVDLLLAQMKPETRNQWNTSQDDVVLCVSYTVSLKLQSSGASSTVILFVC